MENLELEKEIKAIKHETMLISEYTKAAKQIAEDIKTMKQILTYFFIVNIIGMIGIAVYIGQVLAIN